MINDEIQQDFRDLNEPAQEHAKSVAKAILVELASTSERGALSDDLAEFAFACAVRLAELCELSEGE